MVSIDRKTTGAFDPINYSSRLVRTKKDFYDTLKAAAVMSVASGQIITPPYAKEEHQIYIDKSAGAETLRDVEEFRDYFANNDEGVYLWGWNLTGLRLRESDLRKPYAIGDKIVVKVIETDIVPFISQIASPDFKRENWKDIIDKINHVKDEIEVPYARGQVVIAMNKYGIFTEIEQSTEHKTPFALHAWLRENLDMQQDPISGHYDLAVGRWCDRHRVEGCLDVNAVYGRRSVFSNDGFRPVVRGSFPESEKIESVVDADK